MKWIRRIRRHAAIAAGNFGAMFKQVDIPPLPMAVSRLVAEVNRPDPDTDRLVQLISAETGIAAKVIQTVNSAAFALRTPVSDIRRAVTVLGLKNTRSLALAFATMDAVPNPGSHLFDHAVFWQDSLLRAFLARTLARATMADQAEEAFTACLLADVALPVLLSVWAEYYEPVLEQWRSAPLRLSAIEREHFGWDHAQAGAWIVRSWGFPDEMVCYIGAHNLSFEAIREHGLEDTIVMPMAVATLMASVIKTDPRRCQATVQAAMVHLGMARSDVIARIEAIRMRFGEVLSLFGLNGKPSDPVFEALLGAARPTTEENA